MITFSDLWFWQENQPVLKGLNFTINSDERVAILGPSGSGKTTILKLILGLLRPDSGQVIIDGTDIAKISEDALDQIRLKFSIVFQEGALFDSLSVKDNVAFFFKEHTGLSKEQIYNNVYELLKKVDLQQAADLMPEHLSGGMKRRVAIARALSVFDACMYLYDEPTTGLDPVNADIIRNLIIRLAVNGKGFIVVTHEMFDAMCLAKRFMFLKDGEIVYDGDKEEFRNSKIPQIVEYLVPYQRIFQNYR